MKQRGVECAIPRDALVQIEILPRGLTASLGRIGIAHKSLNIGYGCLDIANVRGLEHHPGA